DGKPCLHDSETLADYARACVSSATEALRAEVERLQRQLRQAHKDYGCELRDPNGTIWGYAAAQKARAERLAKTLRFARTRFAQYMDDTDRAALDAALEQEG